jgi:hypothetical protein
LLDLGTWLTTVLDNRNRFSYCFFFISPQVGFEPTTY